MKNILLSAIVTASFFVLSAHAQEPKEAAAAAAVAIEPSILKELKSVWQNQLGSTLEIRQVDPATGQISGTYKSPSGTAGTEFPMIGWVNYSAPADKKDNVIVVSFSVRWGQYGSVTAWNGFYKLLDGKPTIVGQWLLVRSNSDFSWDHTLTGLDTFHPVK